MQNIQRFRGACSDQFADQLDATGAVRQRTWQGVSDRSFELGQCPPICLLKCAKVRSPEPLHPAAKPNRQSSVDESFEHTTMIVVTQRSPNRSTPCTVRAGSMQNHRVIRRTADRELA